MSVGRVVRHFQGAGKVPIDINDVLNVVKSYVPEETIDIWGVDVNPDEFKGVCFRYRKPAPLGSMLTDTRHALIAYSLQMPLCEQRLVCCKEVIHLLDPDPTLTDTKIKVVELADRMVSKTRPSSFDEHDMSAFFDKMARWQALSILFPYALWEELMPRFKRNEITARQVADWLQLPEPYVLVVLTDAWNPIRDAILSFA